jgi:hypothetical protein
MVPLKQKAPRLGGAKVFRIAAQRDIRCGYETSAERFGSSASSAHAFHLSQAAFSCALASSRLGTRSERLPIFSMGPLAAITDRFRHVPGGPRWKLD